MVPIEILRGPRLAFADFRLIWENGSAACPFQIAEPIRAPPRGIDLRSGLPESGHISMMLCLQALTALLKFSPQFFFHYSDNTTARQAKKVSKFNPVQC